MKISKLILVTLLVSAYATITVVHINMAQPKPVAEATLDMIEIMTRAFDESEGGEGERFSKDFCECHTGGVKSPDFSSFQGMTWECIPGDVLNSCDPHPGCSPGSSCPLPPPA